MHRTTMSSRSLQLLYTGHSAVVQAINLRPHTPFRWVDNYLAAHPISEPARLKAGHAYPWGASNANCEEVTRHWVPLLHRHQGVRIGASRPRVSAAKRTTQLCRHFAASAWQSKCLMGFLGLALVVFTSTHSGTHLAPQCGCEPCIWVEDLCSTILVIPA